MHIVKYRYPKKQASNVTSISWKEMSQAPNVLKLDFTG